MNLQNIDIIGICGLYFFLFLFCDNGTRNGYMKTMCDRRYLAVLVGLKLETFHLEKCYSTARSFPMKQKKKKKQLKTLSLKNKLNGDLMTRILTQKHDYNGIS